MTTFSEQIKGHATLLGTERFQDRFADKKDKDFYRKQQDLWLSSIGIGSYLGEADEKTDKQYEESFREALLSGINVLDTAINYRSQRSERTIGRVLRSLLKEQKIARDEVIVCTKGGFLPFEGDMPRDPAAFVKSHYLDTNIVKAKDLVQGCHAMTPDYLEDQLNKSLANLGLETIDIYYLHNPEVQLTEVNRQIFLEKVEKAFAWLEEKVTEKKIRMYGTATWNGYRVSPESQEHLALEELIVCARQAGGAKHHFKAIQLPFNLAMPEAWVLGNQPFGGNLIPVLGCAEKMGMSVFGSASLLQARLAGDLPKFFRQIFPYYEKSSQCSLQFARSVPGLTSALVGMKMPEHVRENLETAKVRPLTEQEMIMMFQQQEEDPGNA